VTAVFEPTVIARIEQERLWLPCWAVDPDLFFAELPAEVEAAKAICVACPVRQACLAGAVTRREPYGVWGGELVIGGTVIARKRPRGRPRKSPVPDPRPERSVPVPTAA